MKHELSYKQKVIARMGILGEYGRYDMLGNVHKNKYYIQRHFSPKYKKMLNKICDPFDIYFYLFIDKKYYESFFMITTIYSDDQNIKLSLLILSFLRKIVRQFNSCFYLSDVFDDNETRCVDTTFKLFYFFIKDSSNQSLLFETRKKIENYHSYYESNKHVSPYYQFKKKFYDIIVDISSAFGNHLNHKSVHSCKLSAFFSVENFMLFISDFTGKNELQKIRDDIFSFSQIIMFTENFDICECDLNNNYRNSKRVRNLLEIDFSGRINRK